MKPIAAAVLPLLALSACATRPDSVPPRPIAQSGYAAYARHPASAQSGAGVD